jgi:hypothetical protein
MATLVSTGARIHEPMTNQSTETRTPEVAGRLPEYFPPSPEQTERLRKELFQYAVDELHMSSEKAELYAKVLSTYYQ